jgi:lysophospholipase L1-like esterase
MKKLLFRFVTYLPAAMLIVFLSWFFIGIHRINNLNHKKMLAGLSNYLSAKEGESMPLPSEIGDAGNSKSDIWIFGESSVVISDRGTFADYLGQRLSGTDTNVRVVNMGLSGIDSFAIEKRVRAALSEAVKKPDLMIFYFGHNDYSNSFFLYITPNYLSYFDPLIKIRYMMDPGTRNKTGIPFSYYAGLTRQKIFKSLLLLHLLRLNASDFKPCFGEILKHYKTNTGLIIKTAAGANIPVIFITPIGNLHAEPYGDMKETAYFYKKGLEIRDYNKSIFYLTKAKDSEFLNFSIRAKSDMNDYIRSLRGKNICVYDLEKYLIKTKFKFNGGNFTDSLHLNYKTHEIIANGLYDIIMSDKNIRQRLMPAGENVSAPAHR